jgi:hypothetical protein
MVKTSRDSFLKVKEVQDDLDAISLLGEKGLTPNQIADSIEKISGLEASASEIDDSVNNSYPKGGMTIKEPSMSGHLLRIPTASVSTPTAYREHLEPNTWINSGTCSKEDLMFDPYDISPSDYRIVNIFTKHNTDGAEVTSGSSCISTKGAGNTYDYVLL